MAVIIKPPSRPAPPCPRTDLDAPSPRRLRAAARQHPPHDRPQPLDCAVDDGVCGHHRQRRGGAGVVPQQLRDGSVAQRAAVQQVG